MLSSFFAKVRGLEDELIASHGRIIWTSSCVSSKEYYCFEDYQHLNGYEHTLKNVGFSDALADAILMSRPSMRWIL